jgi:hypothetical protein
MYAADAKVTGVYVSNGAYVAPGSDA